MPARGLMNGNAESISAGQIDPICTSMLASIWGTLTGQAATRATSTRGSDHAL